MTIAGRGDAVAPNRHRRLAVAAPAAGGACRSLQSPAGWLPLQPPPIASEPMSNPAEKPPEHTPLMRHHLRMLF